MTRTEYEQCINALQQRYATLFAGDHIGRTIAPGWLGIIEDLCARIDAALSRDERQAVHFLQIKEKFGTLRAYLSVALPRVDAISPDAYASLSIDESSDQTSSALHRRLAPLVRAAEVESHRRCLLCGAPGRLRDDRAWILTLCEWHAPFDHRHLEVAFADLTDPDRQPQPPTTDRVTAALRAVEIELRGLGVRRLGIGPPASGAEAWRVVVNRPETLTLETRRLVQERLGWPVAFVPWLRRRGDQAKETEVAWLFGGES
jgi:hypothetical protein